MNCKVSLKTKNPITLLYMYFFPVKYCLFRNLILKGLEETLLAVRQSKKYNCRGAFTAYYRNWEKRFTKIRDDWKQMNPRGNDRENRREILLEIFFWIVTRTKISPCTRRIVKILLITYTRGRSSGGSQLYFLSHWPSVTCGSTLINNHTWPAIPT